jgi:hypothetical protein
MLLLTFALKEDSMECFRTRKALGITVALALLTACAGTGNSGVLGATPASQASAVGVDPDAAAANLSGMYKGTFTDGAYGKGKATAYYSQYHTALGGLLSVKYANATATLSVALSPSGKAVNGNSVAIEGSLYCTFSVQSTYDSKSHSMSGKYSAVQGCGSDKGSFTLKQECYYKGTGKDVRRAGGPIMPC